MIPACNDGQHKRGLGGGGNTMYNNCDPWMKAEVVQCDVWIAGAQNG